MGVKHTIGVWTVVAGLLVVPLQAQTEVGTGGDRVGEVVRSVLETLTPAVGPFLDSIWPSRGKKVTKEELEEELERELAELRSTAAGQLASIEAVAAELELVLEFLEPSVRAQESVVRMTTQVNAVGELDDGEWSLLEEELRVLEKLVGEVGGISNESINKMESIFLREKLVLIRRASVDVMVRLRAAVERRSGPDVLIRLRELERRLRGVTNAAGFLMADLESDLRSLAEWASDEPTPRGGEEEDSPMRDAFARRLVDES